MVVAHLYPYLDIFYDCNSDYYLWQEEKAEDMWVINIYLFWTWVCKCTWMYFVAIFCLGIVASPCSGRPERKVKHSKFKYIFNS